MGVIQTYEWIFSDGITLMGETQQRTFDRAGEYRVSLRVTDNDGLTHQTSEWIIQVIEPNRPPVLVGDQTFQAMENKLFELTLNGAMDPEGAPLTYSIVNGVSSGVLSDCLDGTDDLTCRYMPANNFVGQVVFSYKANDGQRDSETVSLVMINIISYNKKPLANAGPNQAALSGTLVTLDGSGSSDPEGASLTYLWELPTRPLTSRAQLANVTSVHPVFITDRDGTYIARLVVNDGKLDSSPSEVTITVTGEVNAAPTLTPIASPQTIEMGTELRLSLSGSDADSGDTLIFLAKDLPANSRLDEASGKFRFQPLPNQSGDHTVTFIVTDGRATHSQDVVLRVQAAAASQVTSLTSRVLDANEFSQGRTVPISGVTITIVGSTVTTTSDAQGYFTLSNIPHGPQLVSLDATGLMDTNGHHYANFKGRLKIVENVHNRPYRDYILPLVNPAHIAMVDPATPTVVSNTDIGVSMTVPQGTAMNPDGTMYRGPLSVSSVPINATPRELPEVLRPSFLLTLQPVNIRFNAPVPITFPNVDNLAPDTLLDLFSLSEQGGFEKVGLGIVSRDGQRISIVEGGVRATTWHLVTVSSPSFSGAGGGGGGGGGPPGTPPIDGDNNDTGNDGCGAGGAGGSGGVSATTGVLREEKALPSFRISGVRITPTLAYRNTNSAHHLTLIPTYKYSTRRVRFGGNVFRDIVQRAPRSMGLSFEVKGRVSPETFFNTSPLISNGDPSLSPFTTIQPSSQHRGLRKRSLFHNGSLEPDLRFRDKPVSKNDEK